MRCLVKNTALIFSAIFMNAVAYAQSSQELENAYAFSRLYGYVRFFHPSDEAADIDWDRFAIYGSVKVKASRNQQELQEALKEIFLPIAPTLRILKDNERYKFDKQALMPRNKKDYKVVACWGLSPSKPHLDAKIIFLIDGRAISYAESFMGFIEHYKLATIIGQPTAGTNGNVNPFQLPGGYYVSWTGMKVVKHDGNTHHGVGIIPNIYVQKTIKGVMEGRDEFLEKALELTRKPL